MEDGDAEVNCSATNRMSRAPLASAAMSSALWNVRPLAEAVKVVSVAATARAYTHAVYRALAAGTPMLAVV
jgi:hypothetical protein